MTLVTQQSYIKSQISEVTILSEPTLGKVWNNQEEDQAWTNLDQLPALNHTNAENPQKTNQDSSE